MRDSALRVRGADDPQRSSVPGGCEGARVAVGEHFATRIDEYGAKPAHAPIRGDVVGMQGACGLEQNRFGIGIARDAVNRAAHPRERPSEVDGRRA